MCVCVCVCDGRGRERKKKRWKSSFCVINCFICTVYNKVISRYFIVVFAGQRVERERQRDRETERHREREREERGRKKERGRGSMNGEWKRRKCWEEGVQNSNRWGGKDRMKNDNGKKTKQGERTNQVTAQLKFRE